MERYEFQGIQLDISAHELSIAGERIALPPRAMDALIYLVAQRGRTVETSELLREVWAVEALSPSSVPTCIATIRRAMGDDPSQPRLIETVRGRGYRFIAPVRQVPTEKSRLNARARLIGRETEAGALSDELQRSVAGSSRLVAVHGPAGIGKTSLIEDLAARAPEFGAEAIVISTPETGGAPALWPWVQAVRAIDRARPGLVGRDEQLRGFLTPTGNRNGASAIGFEGPATGAEDRFHLFDAVSSGVREAIADRPLVLIFDDFHRADVASFEFLRHIHRELAQSPLMLIAALRYHTDRSGTEHGSQLSSLPRTRELHLHPWTREAAAQFLDSRQLAVPVEDVIDILLERSGGNPFLLTRLIDSMESTDKWSDAFRGLPRGLGDAIAELVGALTTRQARLMTHASVMGREFPLDVLAAALGETTKSVQIEMDRCCARGIVEVVPDTPGRFRFVHLLVRDTFYEHSNASNRAHTHLAVATAMEAARHAQHGGHAAELAHHYFEAAHIGGAKKAVTYAVQAADEARARLALESVPALYRKAMTAADYCADLDEAARCRMLIELGKAEMNASERENGRESLIQAARLAKRIGDVELVARAALSLAPGALALEVGIYDPTLVGLLEETLEAGGALPKALRSHLLARLSLALTWADRESDQRATAEEALALARAGTTPGPLAMALIAQYAVLGGPENLDARTALAHELSVAAGRTGISDLVLMHRLLHVTNLLESRQMARLDAEIDRFRSEAEASQLPHFLWYAGLFRAMRLLVAGEFSEAAEAAENFLAVGSRISDQNAALSFATHCVYHLWETGQSAKAGELGAAFASRFASVAAWPAAAAVFEHDGGDVESARAKIYRQLAQFPTVPHNQVWTTAAAFLTEGCFRVGAADYARKLYKAMAPGVGQIAVVGFGVASAGPISRHLGLLAATFGELDTALRHFSDAIREEIEIGGVPWLAKSKLDMARTLIMRGRRDDIDRSRSLAGEVASITAGNGMKTLNEQARSVAHDANSRR